MRIVHRDFIGRIHNLNKHGKGMSKHIVRACDPWDRYRKSQNDVSTVSGWRRICG